MPRNQRRRSGVEYIAEFAEAAVAIAESRIDSELHPAVWTDDIETPTLLLLGVEHALDPVFSGRRMVHVDMSSPTGFERTVAALIALDGIARRQEAWADAIETLGMDPERVPAWTVAAPDGTLGLLPAAARADLRAWLGDPAKALDAGLHEHDDGMVIDYYGGDLCWRHDGVSDGIWIEDGVVTARLPRMNDNAAAALMGTHVTNLPGLDLDPTLIPARCVVSDVQHDYSADQSLFEISVGRWKPLAPIPQGITRPEVFFSMPVGVRLASAYPHNLPDIEYTDEDWKEAEERVDAVCRLYLEHRILNLEAQVRHYEAMKPGKPPRRPLH